MTGRLLAMLASALVVIPTTAGAQSAQGNWSALASDRTAADIGDALTVVILETASANSSRQNATQRDTRLNAALSLDGAPEASGGIGLTGGFDGRGQMIRSGRLIGQVGVIVDQVLPNGDLHVVGRQIIVIDGEQTTITLSGRVRRADIAPTNTVVSSRLADAHISYDGEGIVSRSSGPGLLDRILALLGLS